MRSGQGDRPALHPLHLRHDRPAEGRRARQWRSHGALEMVDVGDLRHRPGETFWAASDVGWVVGHSYIVYGAAAARLRQHALRGQARRHARRRRVLARHLRARRRGALHRADRFPRHPPRRSRRTLHCAIRPLEIPHAVPRRRARRHRDDRMGRASSRCPGHRSLVADGDRLVDLRQPGRARPPAGQVRLARRADAGLRPAGPRRCRPPVAPARSATSS